MNKWQTTSAKIIGIGLIPMVGISLVWGQAVYDTEPTIEYDEGQEDLSSLYGGEMSMQSETEPDIHVGQVLINKTTADPRFHLDVNGTITGPTFASYNPLNAAGQNGAVVLLNWYNNVPRIRIGGNGIGAGNGLDIQSVGNVSMLRVKPYDSAFNGKLALGRTRFSSLGNYHSLIVGARNANDGKASILLNPSNTDGGMGLFFSQPDDELTIRDWGTGSAPARMTIERSGDVGIGTQSPTEKLEVAGNIKLAGNIVSDGDICLGNCQ